MHWIVEDSGFSPDQIEFWGSKYMIGNGYFGVRGTLEELGSRERVAVNLSGLFDQNGDGWREPVNAPNPFLIRPSINGVPVSALLTPVINHTQSLDLSRGLFSRQTAYQTPAGAFTVSARRFASLDDIHLLALEYTLSADRNMSVTLDCSIDPDTWDLYGPHLRAERMDRTGAGVVYTARTVELGIPLAVAHAVTGPIQAEQTRLGSRFTLDLKAGVSYPFTVTAAIFKGSDGVDDVSSAALSCAQAAQAKGFDRCLQAHTARWDALWRRADVVIEGDDTAQLALRYSLYLLLISTPFHTDRVAIPARGLSGQVYKGAMFWDTELYMLPFFLHTLPETARNLVKYRVHMLPGARAKAAEYGYRGAFYAWESQEDGRDGCTEFNINDVFTGRPIRTYFRDKQIHISADVAYGIYRYVEVTGDRSLLLEGGLEVLLECARFLLSYACYKPDKGRYELLDVTCADEYHERVNNNAYTCYMTHYALSAALAAYALCRDACPEETAALVARLDFSTDLALIEEMEKKLYLPQPDSCGLIEEYDGYFRQEDISPKALHSRIIHPNEYLGSPVGLAVNTQVIKQADVVLVTALFPHRFTREQKLANWRYYEPRTEHGSTLSACIYGLAAADCGLTAPAYDYFRMASMVDLTGAYKLYVGDQYIGGTHPAANGGSWLLAVQGFAGLQVSREGIVTLSPNLPRGWKSMRFTPTIRGQRFTVTVSQEQVTVIPDAANTVSVLFRALGRECSVPPGDTPIQFTQP